MRFVMVTVRDACAGVYGTPYFSVSRGAAVRSFSDEVNRVAEQNILYQHPEHFELFEIGSFDDANGDFEILAKPVSICLASNVAQRAIPGGDERPERTSSPAGNGRLGVISPSEVR